MWLTINPSNKLKKLSEERLSICKQCPFNSKNKKGIINKLLPQYCTICKCMLKVKSICEFCQCPKHKWKEQSMTDILDQLES